MSVSLRLVRNLAFAVLLITLAVGWQKRLLADSCGTVTHTVGSVYLQNCGEYVYDDEAISDMGSTALSYCSNYHGGDQVGLYWWVRDGDYTAPAYYDSYWTCNGWY